MTERRLTHKIYARRKLCNARKTYAANKYDYINMSVCVVCVGAYNVMPYIVK